MAETQIIEQYFTHELLEKIAKICDNFDIPDNNHRADKMMKLLNKHGFYEIGCGTNRIVVAEQGSTSDDDPTNDFVFKIALDGRGIVDNNMEYKLSKILAPKGYVTYNYENTGLISVAERVETMTSFDMEERRDDVFDVINELKDFYVLNDVGPESFKNWGINKDGDVVILDYAYLSNMSEINIRHCTKCEGDLAYDETLSKLICQDCGKEYSFGIVTGGVGADQDLESLGFSNLTVYDEDNDGFIEPEELNSEDFLEELGFTGDTL